MDSQSNLRISYDILNLIIDQLGSEFRYNELKACSQTCHMLLHPCRVYLLSTINLYYSNYAAQFSALLEKNPTIAEYVQELRYSLSTIRVVNVEDLANAFLRLNNLHTLKLYGQRPSDWNALLSPRMQHSLTQLLRSPSLRSLSVYSFYLPASILSSCSTLKHLTLSGSHIFPEACDKILTAPPQLLSLDLSNLVSGAMKGVYNMRRASGVPILDLSNLRSLLISSCGRMQLEDHLENILHSTPKLNSLDFPVFYTLAPNNWVQMLTIVLPTLRFLTLGWAAYDIPTTLAFVDLIRSLEELACLPNYIDHLVLTSLRSWSINDDLVNLDWKLLDQVLADRSGFPRLKKITIELLSGTEDATAEDQAILDMAKVTKFPQLCLATNDYLDFKFETS